MFRQLGPTARGVGPDAGYIAPAMWYPFPRHGNRGPSGHTPAQQTFPEAAWSHHYGHPQPPSCSSAAASSPFAPAPMQPAAASDPAAATLDEAEPTHGFELDLSDEALAYFAQMEMRRSKKGARRGKARSGASSMQFELPQQEDEASRAAMRERMEEGERLRQRYGTHATDVRSLEASLNEAFDHVTTAKGPALWPSVPLKY